MPVDLIQSASWPGVLGVESCEYVCSHGITPGKAVLQTVPQLARPAEYGALAFSDGARSVALRACKVVNVSSQMGASGDTYTLEILDRRWAWATGGVSGVYNQKDDNGKLVPWTIRSPHELAQICLKEMGETGAIINLPPGLPRSAGRNLDAYLKLGQNYPQTLTNPEVVWDHTNPAEALARLCELWGCRVIFQPFANRVYIGPLGKGKPFANLPYEMLAGSIDARQAPAAVACFSTEPLKWQLRLRTEAVGKEWDGTYVPIDQLSYAPVDPASSQIGDVVAFAASTARGLNVTVSFKRPDTGAQFEGFAFVSPGAGTTTQKLDAVAAALSQYAAVKQFLTFTRPNADTLRATANKPGVAFTLKVSDPDGLNPWALGKIVKPAGGGRGTSWAHSHPPGFANVQATDRLSVQEAQALAQESVFRCYRILNRDFHAMNGAQTPLKLPIVGTIARRQQIVLTDTKVDQVRPRPRIEGAVNKANPAGLVLPGAFAGNGALPEFYNGYDRAQRATAHGSVWKKGGGITVFYWLSADGDNTGANQRVFAEFSVNPKEQMIVFGAPVFRYNPGIGGGAYAETPDIWVETGVYILGAETNQLIKWEEQLSIPGGIGPVEWMAREDMRVGVVALYDVDGRITGYDLDGAQDARQRAGYYLRGAAAKYQLKGGEIRQYVGVVGHDPDGYCQQVSVSVGPGGPTTVVSGNTEFHPTIASYPARRRPENLPADKAAALANLAERAGWDKNKADAP